MKFLDLIKNGRHQAIMTHVKTCKYLSTDEELALIKRGNHQEIMAYITDCFKKNSPQGLVFNEEEFLKEWDNIMCLIVQSDDHCAIRRLITQTKLGTNSQAYLSQNGNAEDNLVYELKWGKLHRKH